MRYAGSSPVPGTIKNKIRNLRVPFFILKSVCDLLEKRIVADERAGMPFRSRFAASGAGA